MIVESSVEDGHEAEGIALDMSEEKMVLAPE